MTEGAPHEYKEKPGACTDCGNSPVNHFEHYVSNTLAVWTADALVRDRGLHASLVKWSGRLFDAVEQFLVKTLAAMPFARFSRDVSRATTYRSQVIWEEAARRGIEMEQLVLFGRHTEIYRARMRGMWFYFQSLPIPREKKGESAAWLDDKFLLKQSLSRVGVSVPRSVSAQKLSQAIEAVDQLGAYAVVKPRSGSRGRHTSVRVREKADTEAAFASAKKLCRHIVVEEYLEGPVCRGTVIDGSLSGFFRADPPSVSGDGVSTIRELIQKKNAQKHDRVQDIVLTEEHRRFLSRGGLTEESVLARGKTTPLTHRTGRLFGGTTRELLGSEHPKLRKYLERAAASLGVGVVGFDLIITDPERDPDEQTWGIIEANSLPYIDLHYLALEGEPSNVAAHVWNLWQDDIHTEGVDACERGVRISA